MYSNWNSFNGHWFSQRLYNFAWQVHVLRLRIAKHHGKWSKTVACAMLTSLELQLLLKDYMLVRTYCVTLYHARSAVTSFFNTKAGFLKWQASGIKELQNLRVHSSVPKLQHCLLHIFQSGWWLAAYTCLMPAWDKKKMTMVTTKCLIQKLPKSKDIFPSAVFGWSCELCRCTLLLTATKTTACCRKRNNVSATATSFLMS